MLFRSVVENLIDSLGITKFSFKRESENPSYHPGKTAMLTVGKNIEVGVLGEVHPNVTENYGVDTLCYTAELDLDLLYAAAKTEKSYSVIAKFPAVTRDIALLVNDELLVSELEDTIKKAGMPLVESIKLFDVYKGEQIPAGKKSIAYAIVYRDPKKTLDEKSVGKVHDRILRALEHKCGAELR